MKSLIIVLCLLMLVGCANERVVKESTTEYVGVQDKWIVDCPVVPPPAGSVYLTASPEMRNLLWSKVYTQQAILNGGCNIRLKEARDYNMARTSKVDVVRCVDSTCK